MTVAYTGNLTSFMTNPGFEEPLDTPAKLLEKGVKLGMYNYQGSTTLAFGGSSNPEYCQIWGAKEWITSFGDSLIGTIAGMNGNFRCIHRFQLINGQVQQHKHIFNILVVTIHDEQK